MKAIIALMMFAFTTGVAAQSIDGDQFWIEMGKAIQDPHKKQEVIRMLGKFGPEHRRLSAEQVRNNLLQLNKQLPIQTAPGTHLINTQLAAETILYDFVTSPSPPFPDGFSKLVVNEVCTNPLLFYMTMLDFSVMYRYSHPDGKTVRTELVKKEQCY